MFNHKFIEKGVLIFTFWYAHTSKVTKLLFLALDSVKPIGSQLISPGPRIVLSVMSKLINDTFTEHSDVTRVAQPSMLPQEVALLYTKCNLIRFSLCVANGCLSRKPDIAKFQFFISNNGALVMRTERFCHI